MRVFGRVQTWGITAGDSAPGKPAFYRNAQGEVLRAFSRAEAERLAEEITRDWQPSKMPYPKPGVFELGTVEIEFEIEDADIIALFRQSLGVKPEGE